MGGPVQHSSEMEFTDRDRAILDFERSWWTESGPKEAAIRDRFELSGARYYQILNELLESDEAYEYDVQRRVPDTEKAKKVIGFEATTTLDQMLDEVIPWIHAAVKAGTI